MKVELLPLNKEELAIIPILTKEWITSKNPDVFPLTTYSSPRYVTYLKLQCSIPWKTNTVRFVGAYVDSKLTGFVEYIIMDNTVFINNICIKTEMRGLGIGRIFLDYAALLASENNLPSVSLDCFHWNKNVLETYIKWGFQITSNSYWYVGENPFKNTSNNIEYLVDGYANAELSQQAFGFSNFQVRTNEGKQNIGRIKNEYFRIIEKNQALDKNILKILGQMDSNRSLFIISPFCNLIDYSSFHQVSSSARMELVF